MAKNTYTERFKLENMMLAFPYLLRMRKREEKGVVRLSHEAVLLYPKSPAPLMGVTETKQPFDVAGECLKISVERWGDKAAEWIKTGLIKNPFKDGDGPEGLNKQSGERYAGYAGHKFIRVATGKDQSGAVKTPTCIRAAFGADGKPVVITDPDELYYGCYVHAVVHAWTYDHAEGGKGINFDLSLVQFAKDGERIGKSFAAPSPNSFFESVGPAVAATDAKPSGNAGGLFA